MSVQVVTARSEDLSELAREALATAGEHAAYFLASGSAPFRVPCYREWTAEPHQRAPRATDVLLLGPTSVASITHIVTDLERRLLRGGVRGGVLVEIATRPTAAEVSFVHLVLTSRIGRHRPVLLLVHQPSDGPLPAISARARDALLTLWFSGGRLREPEWHAAHIDEPVTRELLAARLVDRRPVGPVTWYVGTDASAARALARHAQPLDVALARAAHATRGLPWYPVLHIARRLRQLDQLLAAYSPDAVAAARFDDPRGLAAYCQQLRRAAHEAGDKELEHIATVSQVATILALRGLSVHRARRLLATPREEPVGADPDTVASLWFAAGQVLVRDSDPDALGLAEAAFARGRRALTRLPARDVARRASRAAALANGEALVALKQRQFGRARRLEQAALATLERAGDGDALLSQRVLVGAHLGDVQLRGFNDPRAALQAYRAAFEVALSCDTPDELGYVAPRLASAELHTGRPRAAASVLETLFVRAPDQAPTLLKSRLSLADAYVQSQQPRAAAACYWRVLRGGARLTPEAACAIAENLRQVHPAWQARHQRLLDALLREQRAVFARATHIRAALLAA